MNQIALVWNDAGEISVFIFDTKKDKNIVEYCQDAHGHFSTDNSATAELNAILQSERPIYSVRGSNKLINGPFLAIYIAGIL